MDWINEPEEGVAPACGNCFFYAHGSCSTKCSSQACTDCSKIFWPAAPEGRCGIAIWGGEPTLPITPHNCHVVPFY